MIRQIVIINEEKRNGCYVCAKAYHEKVLAKSGKSISFQVTIISIKGEIIP